MEVNEIDGKTFVDKYSGSLVMLRKFRVQRNESSKPHVVSVEVDEAGVPQSERCDCKGFRFRKDCGHVKAVYESGYLEADP